MLTSPLTMRCLGHHALAKATPGHLGLGLGLWLIGFDRVDRVYGVYGVYGVSRVYGVYRVYRAYRA